MSVELNSTAFIIRAATVSDLNSILHLDAISNPHPWGEPLIKDALLTRENWVVSVCDQPERVCAWLTATHMLDQSELELIVVDNAMRRQGIAKRLMQTWLDCFSEQDVETFLLEVRESNEAAIRLYESLAFEQVGLRKNYYQTEQGKEAACLFTLTMNKE